jgi:nucleoside-diphosphate-sugar epimerase
MCWAHERRWSSETDSIYKRSVYVLNHPNSFIMMFIPKNAVIAPGSTILVTGTNGYIGSHVADQLLHFGYKVRGAVRDAEKHAWMKEYFDREYGSEKFELVVIKDLTKKESFAEHLKGWSSIVQTST